MPDDVRISWAPRTLLAGRAFRLPVRAPEANVTLEAEGFERIAARSVEADSAVYHYLRAPKQPGDYVLRAFCNGKSAEATVGVRALEELRRTHTFNGAQWPRRWPLGRAYASVKTRQTLQDAPGPGRVHEDAVSWWTAQPDETLWRQLPPVEIPKAHFVNAHQGCPSCGTAVFRHGGFYPWKRSHTPCDFRSTCPSCGAVFPSNDLARDDFVSGEFLDDGYGYFDPDGHIFLFAATYHRDQTRAFGSAVGALTNRLRAGGFDEGIARQLGLMLLRYAVEECYVASAPQFRYGPSKGVEEPWNWGQPDWAQESDPVAALAAKGTLRYSIDTPHTAQSLALAYDTIWPLLKEDAELVRRAQALGLELGSPEEAILLIEEMLAALLQCILDWGARSNLPNESRGALVLLRALDRADAGNVLDWLYDDGPDTLRVFPVNDFFPDGTPPEATGVYNSIHSNGLFTLEYHLRKLRQQQPGTYPESRYPSLVADPRAPHIVRALNEITMVGKTWFQFGDGSGPGASSQLGGRDDRKPGSVRLEGDCFHAPMDASVLEWAAEFTGDPVVREIRDAAASGKHRRIGPTVQDGVGIAVLRTPEAPERAAAGIVYGDTTGHRHRDLLDVQLFAFNRPFLTDLGYPQSWASRPKWEDHWATHNTAWGALPAERGGHASSGRGRLVRTLFADGIQILDLAADRWAWDAAASHWFKPGVAYRRLLALLETDGHGVLLLDLSRTRGGIEHWRTCRGLEGDFLAPAAGLKPRPGTVADPNGERGDTSSMAHPDYEALAFLDDVASAHAPQAWKGAWQSAFEPAVHLDLHQFRVSPGTELLSARATAVMGKPEESTYAFRTLLWRRKPASDADTSCVDLAFEPRTGDPTLAEAVAVSAKGAPTAAGLHLRTLAGKRIALYWAPDAGLDEPTDFEDGTRLQGALAVVVDGAVLACGAAGLRHQGKSFSFEHSRQTGRIVALDRDACTLDVEGLHNIAPGDRIRVNPDGRAHSYRVETVEPSGPDMVHLKLDVTSLLGRGKIVSSDGDRIELGVPDAPSPFLHFHLMARTGNLHGTRIQPETGGAWAEIAEAGNPGRDRTAVQLDKSRGNPETVRNLDRGTWVKIVDYVEGDPVCFEPRCGG